MIHGGIVCREEGPGRREVKISVDHSVLTLSYLYDQGPRYGYNYCSVAKESSEESET